MYKIIDPRWPEHKRNVHDSGMKILMGLDPKAKWPAGGLPMRMVQGVFIYVRSLEDARERKEFHRVRAICPGCSREMSAGRLFQHKCK